MLPRYFRRRVAVQILALLAVLTALLQMLELLDMTTEVLKREQGLRGLLYYAALRTPAEVVLMLPIAVLLGTHDGDALDGAQPRDHDRALRRRQPDARLRLPAAGGPGAGGGAVRARRAGAAAGREHAQGVVERERAGRRGGDAALGPQRSRPDLDRRRQPRRHASARPAPVRARCRRPDRVAAGGRRRALGRRGLAARRRQRAALRRRPAAAACRSRRGSGTPTSGRTTCCASTSPGRGCRA